MKIAMLGLRSIGEECSGGIERHVQELAIRMAARGHEVTVFCRDRYNPLGNTTWNGIQLINGPAWYSKHLEAITHTVATLPKVLSNFDIVHFHATGPSLFSWAPRLAGRKTVVTVHGLDFKRAKWSGFASFVLRCGAWTAAHCPHATIVVSRTLQKHYREVEKKETHWIPNGVTPPTLRSLNGLTRFGITHSGYILSLGRLVPEKGIHYLIKAFRQTTLPVQLVIAGSGVMQGSTTDPYEESLRAQAQGDERIVFTGPLYGEDKDEAFTNASLFTLPSDLEGMPIAMLEAMSYGCPVLASDIPECTEIWEAAEETNAPDICAHFHSGSPNSLQAALERVMYQHDLADMGERGKRYVLATYNWDELAHKTLEVYQTLP